MGEGYYSPGPQRAARVRELFGRMTGWKTLIHLPLLMALGVGISINNAKAVLEAIWGAIRNKPSEFIRTPKYGATTKVRSAWQGKRVLTFKRLALPIVEVAFGFYVASFIVMSLFYDYARGSIPFLAIFAGGYFYVGFSSLHVLWKMHLDSKQSLEIPAVEPAIT